MTNGTTGGGSGAGGEGVTDRLTKAIDDLRQAADSATGEVRLYEGSNTRGTLIDTFKVGAGHSLDSILISNDEGGDVALENLKVRMLTYREIGGTAANR